MIKFFKKDKILSGIILGIILPAIIFLIVYSINSWAEKQFNDGNVILTIDTLLLISIFANLFTFRSAMIKRKKDQKGKGILIVTFVFAIVYFYLYLKS